MWFLFSELFNETVFSLFVHWTSLVGFLGFFSPIFDGTVSSSFVQWTNLAKFLRLSRKIHKLWFPLILIVVSLFQFYHMNGQKRTTRRIGFLGLKKWNVVNGFFRANRETERI